MLKFFITTKKIPNIVIYTNGTIVPRASGYLINEKIALEITDYGKLSRNFDRLIKTCDEKKINYIIRDLGESWDDSANIIKPLSQQSKIKKYLKNVAQNICSHLCMEKYTVVHF